MGANPVNLNVQSPSKRFYLVSEPTELAVPKRFADDAKNLFRRSASYRPYRTSSENMGCAASQPEGGANAGLGTPGKKQGQAPTEAEKDEAAGLIQGFATEYSKHKKEKEQDEAAHEIQVQAAAFLAKAQSDKEAKEETAKPKLTLPPAPPPLTVAATAAVDAILSIPDAYYLFLSTLEQSRRLALHAPWEWPLVTASVRRAPRKGAVR